MVVAELRKLAHGNPVLLVDPGKLQPELALSHRCCGVAAGNEHPQGGVSMRGELLHTGLKGTELIQGPARKQLHVAGIGTWRVMESLQDL